MQKELIFSILAFAMVLTSTAFAWRGIIRGEIIPHPFTFFIWTIVLAISSWELIQSDERWSGAVIAFLTLACITELVVGLYRWRDIAINYLDYFFLISGILLIVYWLVEPNYRHVLLVMIGIDAFAYASSFKKAWIQPFTEKTFPYILATLGNICTILSISVWNFENLGMWIWTAGINFTFACFILARQYYKKGS